VAKQGSSIYIDYSNEVVSNFNPIIEIKNSIFQDNQVSSSAGCIYINE